MLIKHHIEPKQAFSDVLNELRKGSSDSRHPFRYVSLASFNADKQESNIRMLILREVDKDGTLTLYSDARTSKVKELKQVQQSALLFWHDYHKVQVTMKSEVRLHHRDETSEDYWNKDVHGAARKAYTPLVEPGEVIENPKAAHQWPEEFSSEHFCVIRCVPYEIDILQLAGKKHLRLRFLRNQNTDGDAAKDDWKGEWVAP